MQNMFDITYNEHMFCLSYYSSKRFVHVWGFVSHHSIQLIIQNNSISPFFVHTTIACYVSLESYKYISFLANLLMK